jgi:hypothetical protein
MTHSQFDEFQEKLIAEVVEMKNTKGKEYANSESRFANFDRLSVELGIPNYQDRVGLKSQFLITQMEYHFENLSSS